MNSKTSNLQKKSQSVRKSSRSCFRVGFLVIFSALFILSNFVWILSFNLQRFVFNPEKINSVANDQLDHESIFQNYISILSNSQRNGTNSDRFFGLGTLLSGLPPESSIAVQELLLPDDFIEALFTNSLATILTWVDSEEPALEIMWDMTPLKNRISGAEGQEALSIAVNTLPDCTPEEMNNIIAQLVTDPSSPLITDRVCQFTEPYDVQQMQIFSSALDQVNGEISPTYIVTPVNGDGSGNMRLIKGVLRFIQSYGQWGWVVSLSLLSLILLAGVRSLDTLGGWVGIPLLLSGMLVLAFAVVTRAWILFRLTSILTQNLTTLFAGIFNSILEGISGVILQPMMIHGIFLLLIGGILLAMLVIRRIIKLK